MINRLYPVLVDYPCAQILVHVRSLIFELSSTFTTYLYYNPNNLPLDLNMSKSENSHHVPCACIHAQLNKLDFISISLPVFHNPLTGFTTWLGPVSSGPTWTLLPNDLLDLYKICENLFHHRSNDLNYLVARLVPIFLQSTTKHPSMKPSQSLIVPQQPLLKPRITAIHQM